VRISLTFEETSRWPDDLTAIGHVKTALLCAIGQGIEQEKNTNCRAWLSPNNHLNVLWSHQLFVLDVCCPR
jgi:hypothetical protein